MTETWRIRNITIKNYKAFASIDSENTPIDGKNVLLYGGNGTGKSTLYEALKLLTQSMSQKDDVSSRFKTGAKSHQHIYSINKSAENKSAESYITYELFREDIAEYKSCKHTLSRSSQPEWGTSFQKAHLASDYMTYRVLYDLFKKNEDGNVNIWDVFEAEMLPFINDLEGNPILNKITNLRETIKNLDNSPNDIDIDDRIQKINNQLNAEIVSIIDAANNLYKKFFESKADHRAITFNLDTTNLFQYDKSKHKLINPELIFTVKTQEIDVPNPLSFLNEAALSQIAISIRFAVTQIKLHESPFKLLVIDDLLISLDMDNRDKVINLLMDEDFSSYQMFVFTHDNRFFEGFRDKLQSHQVRWTFLRLTLESGSNGKLQSGKSYEQIVEDYLLGHGPLAVDPIQLAQLLLRKAIENTLETNSTNVTELSEKNFTSATSKVYAAMNTIHKEYAMDLLDKLKKIANTYKIAKYQKDEAAAQNATQELYTLLNNLDDRFENYQILKEIVEALKKLNLAAHGKAFDYLIQSDKYLLATVNRIKDLKRIMQDSSTVLPQGALPLTSKPNDPSQPPQSGLMDGVSSPQSPYTNGSTRGRPSTLSADGLASESAITDKSIHTPKSSLGADQNDNTQYLSNKIWTWLNTFAAIDSTISIHTDVMSLDRETRLTQRLEYGIAFDGYLIPIQVIDKVDESSILHNFTNKTMLTVYTNNVKNDITVKPTSLGILIDGDKLELRSYPKGEYDGTHSVIESLNMKYNNYTRLLYNQLLNILL